MSDTPRDTLRTILFLGACLLALQACGEDDQPTNGGQSSAGSGASAGASGNQAAGSTNAAAAAGTSGAGSGGSNASGAGATSAAGAGGSAAGSPDGTSGAGGAGAGGAGGSSAGSGGKAGAGGAGGSGQGGGGQGGGGQGGEGGAGAGGAGAGGAGASGAGAGGAGGAGSGGAGAGGGGAGAAGSSAGSAGAGGSCVPVGSGAPRLSISGKQILDPVGKPILLRGWNWGLWGSVQPQDAADHAAQGANVVRIPLRWWGVYDEQGPDMDPKLKIDSRQDEAPGHIEPGHLELLDQMVQQAACQGLWVDLFVDSNCGQASATSTAEYCGTAAGGAVANFANKPEEAERFAEVWEFLVKRYKKQPFIAMYEILPEPQMGCSSKKNCDNWGVAPAFYKPIIERIRAIDPTTPLLIGPDGGYDVTHIDTVYLEGAPGLIYTGNFLEYGSQHPEFVAIASAFSQSKQVPVFIQQVGIRKGATDATTHADTILKTLNDAGMGWTWWTYRETKSPSGLGFAPLWKDKDSPWMMDAAWLELIRSKF